MVWSVRYAALVDVYVHAVGCDSCLQTCLIWLSLNSRSSNVLAHAAPDHAAHASSVSKFCRKLIVTSPAHVEEGAGAQAVQGLQHWCLPSCHAPMHAQAVQCSTPVRARMRGSITVSRLVVKSSVCRCRNVQISQIDSLPRSCRLNVASTHLQPLADRHCVEVGKMSICEIENCAGAGFAGWPVLCVAGWHAVHCGFVFKAITRPGPGLRLS